MKRQRQMRILELIGRKEIETQEELSEELSKLGFDITQATVSRDINELRLVKMISPSGKQRYAVSGSMEFSMRMRTIFRESVLSFDQAQNLVVLKTMPGMASAACSAIDAMKLPTLVGSLAGDDTAFLALRDNASALELVKQLENI